MEFTAEEFEQAQIHAYQATKDRIEIPGFRKGKAPRSIIEKHFGAGVFFEDALDELIRESYPAALDELELDLDANRKIKTLSVAQQQMIEIAKAVYFNAKVLVLDEPTAALSNTETEALFKQMAKLKQLQMQIVVWVY